MSNQRGAVQFTTILLTALVVIGGYIVVRIVPAYILDFKIKNIATSAAKFSVDSSKASTVPMYLKKQIYENELPVAPEDFVIEDFGEGVSVTVAWSMDVAFIPENGIVPPVIRRFAFEHEEVAYYNR